MKGRTAQIIDGAGQVGSAMADALAGLEENVVLMDISQNRLNITKEKLQIRYATTAK